MAPPEDMGLKDRLQIEKEVEETIKEWKVTCTDQMLVNAYETFFEKYYEPDFSCRNGILVDLVTNLYGKVCIELLQRLVEVFHRLHAGMFKDPIDSHMKEFASHFRAVETTFLESLRPSEREFYECLPDRERDAFRICRSLAECELGCPPPSFFLSGGGLASRLMLTDSKIASRILMRLRRLKVIGLVEVGTQWKEGRRPKATIWEWKLSLPANDLNGVEEA